MLLFSDGFSIFLNSFLIYLVLTRSPKNLGAYIYLMIFISVFEIVYSMLDILLQPSHYSQKTIGIVLVETQNKLFSPFTLLVLDSFYWGFFGASLGIFAIHFIYRYLVVSESYLLNTFNSWKVLIWMLLPIISCLIWVITSLFLCGPNKETSDFVRDEYWKLYNKNIDDFVYLGYFLYETTENGVIVHWKQVIALAISLSTMAISVVIVLVFGIKCYKRITSRLKLVSSASSKTQRLQAQLFYALVLQTLIPTVLMHTPVAVIMGFMIANAGLEKYTYIVSITISLYPAIDPLPSFFLITPYRKAVLEIFGRKSTNRVSTVVSSTGVNTTL